MRKQLFVWGGVAVVAGIAVLLLSGRMFRPEGSAARISYKGEVVRVVSLETNGKFSLAQDPTVQFVVRDGAIAFLDATCPDKICERTGFLSRVGETAACLPRKTVVTVIVAAQEGEADAIAG